MPVELHVEYAERIRRYGILFIFSLLCEYINLEYVWVPVIYRVDQAEYVHNIVAASQEYVNTYSTRRPVELPTRGERKTRNRKVGNIPARASQ